MLQQAFAKSVEDLAPLKDLIVRKKGWYCFWYLIKKKTKTTTQDALILDLGSVSRLLAFSSEIFRPGFAALAQMPMITLNLQGKPADLPAPALKKGLWD